MSPSTFNALLASYQSGEYFHRLINQPTPHPMRNPPELRYYATLNRLEPRYTVVMPTFEHENTIEDTMAALASSASIPFDWVVVDDGSCDRTIEQATLFFAAQRNALIGSATILRNPVPVYETACDNLGFALAETEAIIEVQADIQIREAAFDALLLRGLATTPRPSGVSGRCGHSFASLRPLWRRWTSGRRSLAFVGLCGKAIDTPEVVNSVRGRLYRCETVNRGPWAVLRSDLERHGYLDERHFFLGNDDHDYHRRLFETEGRRPLYAAMSLYSPLTLGAGRRKRTGVNRTVFQLLKAEKRGSPAFHRFLASLGPTYGPEEIA